MCIVPDGRMEGRYRRGAEKKTPRIADFPALHIAEPSTSSRG